MIEFNQVRKQYGERDVLAGVSFRIGGGERVGVVGPNGAGKSTVFALIEGAVLPDRGEVIVPRSVRLGHLRQQLNAHAVDGTVLDYAARGLPRLEAVQAEIRQLEAGLSGVVPGERERRLQQIGTLQSEFEHLGGYEMRTRAEVALSGLGFGVEEIARPFRAFSGGWQMRAELARTLVARPDILLLDEPSNYLDLPAVEWLQRFLRDYPGTMLLISHDRYLLDSLTGATLEIAGGQATRYPGNYAAYLRQREARTEQQLAAHRNQQRKIEKIEQFVERFRYKASKAAQVQSRVKMLEKMEVIEAPGAGADLSRLRLPPAPHSGYEMMRLEDAGLSYDGVRWVLSGINLAVHRGEKIALVGYNGTGKTTLLRLLAGAAPLSAGRRVPGHQVVVGYQSQEFADTMPPDQSAFDIVRAADPAGDAGAVRTLLGGFGFSGTDVDKPCRVLSGGEKIRLAFARIFANPPNLLLLDEPTTHLDIHGREALERALAAYDGTLCLVSHDVTFVRNVAEQVIAMTPPGITRYAGGYAYYLEKRGGREPAAASSGSGRQARRRRVDERKARAAAEREVKRRIARAESAIEQLEAEQADLVRALEAGGAVDYAATSRRLAGIQQDLAMENEHWEAAMRELDGMATDG